MKREVPVAQFFPLEAPSAYEAYRKALTLNPSPALRLTTQPETLDCVMKYIFNWPVKGAELLYTCLLNLWQTMITYCSLAYSFPLVHCNRLESHLKNTRQNLILRRERAKPVIQAAVGRSHLDFVMTLCFHSWKQCYLDKKCKLCSENSVKTGSISDMLHRSSEDKRTWSLQKLKFRTPKYALDGQ